MKKLAFALLFATALLAKHHDKGGDNDGWYGDDNGWNGQKGDSVHMPEPSAIPELILCVGGVSFLAWRQRKTG
jgi:hypothetical protein